MATGFNLAERLPDHGDWSESHRQPPPIPFPLPSHDSFQDSIDLSNNTRPNTSRSTRAASISIHPRPPPRASVDLNPTADTRTFSLRPRSRGNSFSFLRRSSSIVSNKDRNTLAEAAPPVPELPKSILSQAQMRVSSDSRRPSTSLPPTPIKTMLRKVSRQKVKEQSPSPSTSPLPPPHLPFIDTFPDIATFGGDDTRPDSVAIFNHGYTSSQHPAHQPRTTTNFSRHHAMAPSLVTSGSSSPPGYVAGVAAAASPDSSSTPPTNVPLRSAIHGEYVVDPYGDRAESMAHRGRFSYASSSVNAVHSPRRVRRRKDPTPFNVLIVGAKNSGKSSFVNFLRHSLSSSPDSKTQPQTDDSPTSHRGSFTSTYLETEMSGERIGLTLWDSAGLEKSVVDLQLREMTTFVESKFEDTFVEEQKVMRSPGIKDTHIHCVLLLLDPVNLDSSIAKSTNSQTIGKGTLNEDHLDMQVMQALWGKTTIIPVVGKADTLTMGHMAYLKRVVWDSLKSAQLDPLEALELEDTNSSSDDDDDGGDYATPPDNDGDISSDLDSDLPTPSKSRRNHKRQSPHTIDLSDTPYLPMSILSPDPYDLPPFTSRSKSTQHSKVGRRFPWGIADPHNPSHCDFGRLRDSVFLEWRSELRDLSRSRWYENWRTMRLKGLPAGGLGGMKKVRGVSSGVSVGAVRAASGIRESGRMVSGGLVKGIGSVAGGEGVPRNVSGLSSASEKMAGGSVNGNGISRVASGGESEVGSVRRN